MDTCDLNIEHFRSRIPIPHLKPVVPRSIQRVRGHFLKGPIPWDWLATAGKLPGKAIQVALEIWRESGCRSSRLDIPLSTGRLKSLGVSRKASYSALKRLEAAKLIKVNRRQGCLSSITILDTEELGRRGRLESAVDS